MKYSLKTLLLIPIFVYFPHCAHTENPIDRVGVNLAWARGTSANIRLEGAEGCDVRSERSGKRYGNYLTIGNLSPGISSVVKIDVDCGGNNHKEFLLKVTPEYNSAAVTPVYATTSPLPDGSLLVTDTIIGKSGTRALAFHILPQRNHIEIKRDNMAAEVIEKNGPGFAYYVARATMIAHALGDQNSTVSLQQLLFQEGAEVYFSGAPKGKYLAGLTYGINTDTGQAMYEKYADGGAVIEYYADRYCVKFLGYRCYPDAGFLTAATRPMAETNLRVNANFGGFVADLIGVIGSVAGFLADRVFWLVGQIPTLAREWVELTVEGFIQKQWGMQSNIDISDLNHIRVDWGIEHQYPDSEGFTFGMKFPAFDFKMPQIQIKKYLPAETSINRPEVVAVRQELEKYPSPGEAIVDLPSLRNDPCKERLGVTGENLASGIFYCRRTFEVGLAMHWVFIAKSSLLNGEISLKPHVQATVGGGAAIGYSLKSWVGNLQANGIPVLAAINAGLFGPVKEEGKETNLVGFHKIDGAVKFNTCKLYDNLGFCIKTIPKRPVFALTATNEVFLAKTTATHFKEDELPSAFHAVGGGALLVENGLLKNVSAALVDAGWSQDISGDARTAIAFGGSYIFLVVSDGWKTNIGLTLERFRDKIAGVGGENVILFDSGGSSQIVIPRKGPLPLNRTNSTGNDNRPVPSIVVLTKR